MGRRGAIPSVIRAIAPTQDGASGTRSGQVAVCDLCASPMEFDTNEYTQLIERCTGTKNAHCPHGRWHRRRVDPSILLPPDKPKKRRGPRAPVAADE